MVNSTASSELQVELIPRLSRNFFFIMGSAEALPIMGSAEALPILCVRYFR